MLIRLCPKCGAERPATEVFCGGAVDGAPCDWDLSGEAMHEEGWRPPVIAPVSAPAPAPGSAAGPGTTQGALPGGAHDGRLDGRLGGPLEGTLGGRLEDPLGGSPAGSRPPRTCLDGHPLGDGDLICPLCGAEPSEPEAEAAAGPAAGPEGAPPGGGVPRVSSIGDWEILSGPDRDHPSSELYSVRSLGRAAAGAAGGNGAADGPAAEGLEATLHLFKTGFEPDPRVYEAVRRLPRQHVPLIHDWGRWENRFYCVAESFSGKFLSDLAPSPADGAEVRRVVEELGRALDNLTEEGIRHRDLNPGVLAVRSESPLDLVITGFGSARLSDFDLDLVAPLETSLYTAPEAIAGAVSPASDWWSLGMILLELLTGGAIFAGVNPKALAIRLLSRGIAVPEDLPADLRTLLSGLLTRDHAARWRWPEVEAWLAGRPPELPPEHAPTVPADQPTAITLGGRRFTNPEAFALQAAEPENWDEAAGLLRRGGLATWLAALASAHPENEGYRETARFLASPQGGDHHAPAAASSGAGSEAAGRWALDRRLMLALKLLNPAMPLVIRGDLLSPGWLLANPREGYALIEGDVPRLLGGCLPEEDNWLLRLQNRLAGIRARADDLGIPLREDALRIYSLNTSRSRLAVIWEERLKAYPDTAHPGAGRLLSLPEPSDVDLVVLLSAEPGLFVPIDEVLIGASRLAAENGVEGYSPEEARRLAPIPRPRLNRALDERLRDLAYSGNTHLDQLAQEYRVRRRLPLTGTLAVLATPAAAWRTPPGRVFVQRLLGHFGRKMAAAGMRGPLVRMLTGDRSTNIDLADLATERAPAGELAERILSRGGKERRLDPGVFEGDAGGVLAGRLGRLLGASSLHLRDTGLNGLYAGFPFLFFRPDRQTRTPRVMPILLWPVVVSGDVYEKSVALGFDQGRGEVRLNPFLEAVAGRTALRRWEEAADRLLALQSSDLPSAMGILSAAADDSVPALQRLSPRERPVPAGRQLLVASMVLFHAAFAGQAIGEELRALALASVVPGALGTLLDVHPAPAPSAKAGAGAPAGDPDWPSFLVTHRDPSQERAVQMSRSPEGLLVEGPPGTGKSQTIVNMISQALGDKRSVLVVCQKRAALEVVRKRLAAEGLSDRIIMLTDSVSERLSVIKQVRDQVERLLDGTTPSPVQIAARRGGLLRQMGSLEEEIDAHHEALHGTDPRCGLGFRAILGRLVGLEGENAGLRAPRVGELLAPLTADEAYALVEECAPLAGPWLESDYEDSPLRSLETVVPDDPTLESLAGDVAALHEAEIARSGAIGAPGPSAPGPAGVVRDARLHDWLVAHGAFFEAMGDRDLADAPRYLPLFVSPAGGAPPPGGEAVAREVEELTRSLAACPMAEWSPLLSPALAASGLSRLGALLRDSAPEPPGFLGTIAPWRIVGRMRVASALKRAGLKRAGPDGSSAAAWAAAKAELHGAARLELAARPLRRRLRDVHLGLGLKPPAADETTSLAALARRIADSLRSLGPALSSLALLPEGFPLETALLHADRAALDSALALLRAASKRHLLAVRSLSVLEAVEGRFAPAAADRLREAVTGGGRTPPLLESIVSALPRAKPFMAFRRRLAGLPEKAEALFALMRPLGPSLAAIEPAGREGVFRAVALTEALSAWRRRLEEEKPILGLETSELSRKIDRLKDFDDKLRDLNRGILAASINPSKIADRSAWEAVTRLRGQRSLRLRQFVDRAAPLGLFELRPVWLLNPDTASRILPRVPNLFDLAVFDEASQIPVEYAVPALYRATAPIVSGDDKQMPPSSFFTTSVDQDDGAESADEDGEAGAGRGGDDPFGDGSSRREIMDCADMLELARRKLPRTTLQIHYRSAYRELIAFSNAAFYDGRLHVPANHPPAGVLRDRPLRYVDVGGLYRDQTNADEAARVVDLLAELWDAPERPSAGVVTFNQKQASLIGDLIAERAGRDEAFRLRHSEESNRLEDGEDMSFFVKNVENVQGDERDVIIFSSTFGKDENGRFIRNFGALGHQGGERRLNVAVTRARIRVVLVSSMPVKDISDMLATARPPRTPRDYLQLYWAYVRALASGEFGEAERILGRAAGTRGPGRRPWPGGAGPDSGVGSGSGPGSGPDSGVLAAARACLAEAGWETRPGDPGSVFGLDLLLEDKLRGAFFMGVECDSPRHPLLAAARAREIWRPAALRRGCPVIHRVSSKAWLEDPAKERAALLEAARGAFGAGGGGL